MEWALGRYRADRSSCLPHEMNQLPKLRIPRRYMEKVTKAMPELNSSESSLVSDPGISTLEKAFDPVVLGEYLPEVLPSEWGTIRNIRLQVLRHKRGEGRCTF